MFIRGTLGSDLVIFRNTFSSVASLHTKKKTRVDALSAMHLLLQRCWKTPCLVYNQKCLVFQLRVDNLLFNQRPATLFLQIHRQLFGWTTKRQQNYSPEAPSKSQQNPIDRGADIAFFCSMACLCKSRESIFIHLAIQRFSATCLTLSCLRM